MAVSFRGVSKKYATAIDASKKYSMRDIFLPSLRARKALRPQEVLALHGLSFTVQAGQSVLVLGFKDSGKSTAARLIAGLTYPSTGTVDVRGRSRLVAGQVIGATPVMRVVEYARLLAMMMGADSVDLGETVARLLSDCHLSDWRNLRVHNAPDGAVKRLAYFAALTIDADVYVFDEMLRMRLGDPELEERVEARLQELFETRTVVVFASKPPADAEFDRALVMHRGDSVYDGTPELAKALHGHIVQRADEGSIRSVEEEVERAEIFLASVNTESPQDAERLAWDFDVSLGADREIRTIAEGDKPIIIGPYLSQVDTELMLWIPFVRGVTRSMGVDPDRIVCVSRGGADHWYSGVGGQYFDALELMSPIAFGRRYRVLLERNGSRQMGKEELDDLLMRRTLHRLGLARGEDAGWLHPSLFFRLLMAAWRGAVGSSFVLERLKPERIDASSIPRPEIEGPYIAVCFSETPYLANDGPLGELVSGVIDELVGSVQLIDVNTGRRLSRPSADLLVGDQAAGELEEQVGSRTALSDRTQIIAHAMGLLAAHGGLSYLAAMLGVPAVTLYHEPSYFRPVPQGFRAVNFRLGWQVLEQLSGRVPTAVDAAKIARSELLDLVRSRFL